ncbi:MAG: hypothetical protein KQH63_19525 [Desulfobulbaceae bacterium]|nr:hypothetical protein [Desulfobulbaceae bacterium]
MTRFSPILIGYHPLFVAEKIPLFLQRFGISFTVEGSQITYCVYEKASGKDVSCSLEICIDHPAQRINVLMFYPGLSQLLDTHYFSAACFFLVIYHFAQYFKVSADYTIHLETKVHTFNSFYARLKDFDFQILHRISDTDVELSCHFCPLVFDTSVIGQRTAILIL